MSSIYETGHGKNVANLLKFNQLLATYGLNYNPGNATISVASFGTLYTATNTNLINATASYIGWKTATNNREIAFFPLKELATKLLGALESTNASDQTIADFKFLVRKVHGSSKRIELPVPENEIPEQPGIPNPNPIPIPEEPTTKSTNQQSFDNLLQHFSKMILTLQTVPSYTPNEVALQIVTLQALLVNLTNINNAANVSIANLRSIRIARNLMYYAKETGMLDRVKKSKSYIKSIFGATSQQYKAATAIKFFRIVSTKKAK